MGILDKIRELAGAVRGGARSTWWPILGAEVEPVIGDPLPQLPAEILAQSLIEKSLQDGVRQPTIDQLNAVFSPLATPAESDQEPAPFPVPTAIF